MPTVTYLLHQEASRESDCLLLGSTAIVMFLTLIFVITTTTRK